VKDLVGAVLGIEGTEERRRAVEVLREAHPEAWQQAALELLQKGDDAVRDEAARLLIGSPSEARARSLIADAVHAPRNYPELFAWCCKAHMAGQDSPLLQPFKAYPPQEILGRVFDALDNLGMRSERDGKAVVRDTLARVRALLTVEESRFFRDVVVPLAREDARGVYRRVLSSGGLSEPLRVKLLEILMAEFPDITREKVRPIWEDDFIYVTEGGLAKKQAEFRDITEEKLPKNFQDIGRAAAFGDLSENAEYTSALEERDRLTKRATEIKAQLDRVRIIKPDMLKSGEITLGARVRLLNAHTNHEVAYRILGPWDGGPEDGVLNYGSPLAITLLGKRVGDEVEAQLPGGAERFRVVKVGSAFEPDPSSR
jgi:transcription elongation factor GreA